MIDKCEGDVIATASHVCDCPMCQNWREEVFSLEYLEGYLDMEYIKQVLENYRRERDEHKPM